MLMPPVMAFHDRGSEGDDRPQGQSINRGDAPPPGQGLV
jgi:hypothetical protein